MNIKHPPPSCISLETGTLVFAVFNIVVVSLASIATVVALIYCGMRLELQVFTKNCTSDSGSWNGERWDCNNTVLWAIIIWILMTISLVSMVFSALLINGVVNRKPGHMKAYFIYGVVMIVLFMLATIPVIYKMWEYNDHNLQTMSTASFIIYFVYIGSLVMIRLTYRKIENLNSLHNEQRLATNEKIQQIPFSCMSVHGGTLTFAIFNIVITSLACIVSIVSLIYWGLGLLEANLFWEKDDWVFRDIPDKTIYFFCIGSLILMTAALVSQLFAGLLVYGVIKREAELMKVYFVYGVVVDVLSVLAAIAFLLLTVGDMHSLLIVVGCFITCFVYTGILVMIRQTYRNFEKVYYEDDHQQLVEAPADC